MKKPGLDLLIPCYNPPKNWDKMIRSSVAALQVSLPDTKLNLILVNDGSTKALNPTALENLKKNIHSFLFIDYPKNQGKGHALRQAAERANSDLQILIDVDFPYTNESILKVYYSLVVEKSDLVLGYRNAAYYQHTPPIRKVISKTLRFLLKHIIRLPVADTQCGLKGFNEKGKKLFLQTKINSYLFDLEFVMLSSKNKLNTSAVHVNLKEGVVFTRMKLSVLIKEASHFFRLLFFRN